MKVWITKYALTKGIIEADGELTSSESVSILNRGYPFRHTGFIKETGIPISNLQSKKLKKCVRRKSSV